MKLRHIALNNLRRRKSKMVFLIVGMTIGIATVVAISNITSALEHDVRAKLDEFGANIVIVPKSNTLSMSYGGISIPGAQYDVKEIEEANLNDIYTIKNKENLATVSPKLLGAVDIGGRKVLIVGADLSVEIKLKKWWKFTNESNVKLVRTQRPSPIDPTKNMTITEIEGISENDMILGSGVSEQFGKKPGDKIAVGDEEFTVRAVLTETGSQDDSIIFLSLPVAQRVLGKEGKITLVEVAAICSGCPVEEMARQINEKITDGKATPVKQVVASRMQTIRQLQNFGYTVGIIVLVIGSLIVFTTMMSSVNERTREIGIFRAIGFRRTHVIKLIFMEAITLSLIAGLLGYGAGTVAGSVIGPRIAGMSAPLKFDYIMAAGSTLMAVFIGTAATISPALKASKIDPVEALRQI